MHFPITIKQVQALIAHNYINYMTLENRRIPTEEEKSVLKELETILDSNIVQFPKGAFIRLGSRSPKDSWLGYREGFRCASGVYALKLLCDSERIYEDLYLALGNSYTPHLVVREWVEIKSWQEFRAFYKNRKLVGLSQYNYLKEEVFSEVAEMAGSIEWAIRLKSEMVAPLLPADNVIVDYIYRIRQHGNENVNEVVLLECNPFMVYTDPCLFNWSRDTFQEFEFRFCKVK